MSATILFQSENLKLIEFSYSCAKEYVILSKYGSLKFEYLSSYKLGYFTCLTVIYKNKQEIFYLDKKLEGIELKEFCESLDNILLNSLSPNINTVNHINPYQSKIDIKKVTYSLSEEGVTTKISADNKQASRYAQMGTNDINYNLFTEDIKYHDTEDDIPLLVENISLN